MELGLQIALRLLIAGYVGLGLWMTILVIQKAGLTWFWALIPWAPSLFWVVPGLEIVGLVASPVPIVMLYIFAFVHWPAVRPAGPTRVAQGPGGQGMPPPVGHSVDVATGRGVPAAAAAAAHPAVASSGAGPDATLNSAGVPAVVPPVSDAAASGARRAFSDNVEPDAWLLTGFDEDGRVVRIEIPDFELKGNPAGFLIGRNPAESDFQISDDSVSRKHARLFSKRDKLYVEDLESANGTVVDDEELHPGEPASIVNGGIVEFGAVKLNVSRG